MLDATHIESATLVTLKSERRSDRCSGRIHSVATSESRATITVATGGPNTRTDVKTNASDTEMRAMRPGTRTVNEPVRRVRTASTSQSLQISLAYTSFAESIATLDPARMTTPR